MYAYLTVVRYPKWLAWAGFLSMAYFRLPLYFNKKILFYKLMGCGRNGTFDKIPDTRQWCLLVVTLALNKQSEEHVLDYSKLYGSFIACWWKVFNCSNWTLVLKPIEGHGSWDGKKAFGILPRISDYEGIIAVLTRATIKVNRLSRFWRHVNGVAEKMASSKGFITSLGIGEIPWLKQATFSIWDSKEDMKAFSYNMQEHVDVIRKTREERWYSEEMFIRFKIIASVGTIHKINPLEGKL